ncbi:MAG: hypothetical protein FWF07_01505 [Methanomassiliicoccaceae archaeon]|nr:hypothetical protein [Methanomassiliicoccaceae archaeon]
MIEFTMSRVILIVCGVAVLASVMIPIQSFYGERYDSSMEDAADRLSLILDEFWASEADTVTIRGWEILPSSDCFVEIEGHSLTVHFKERSYRSLVKESMERVVIGHKDMITLTKPVPPADEEEDQLLPEDEFD